MIGISVLAMLCLLGVVLFNNKTQASHSEALGRVLRSIEELDSSSEIILQGTILPKTEEIKLRSFTNEQYPTKINNLVKNETSIPLKETDTIILSEVIELAGDTNIEPGEYLLFLNSFVIDEKRYYSNNSVNNLYKYKNNKYINVFGDRFLFHKTDDSSL